MFWKKKSKDSGKEELILDSLIIPFQKTDTVLSDDIRKYNPLDKSEIRLYLADSENNIDFVKEDDGIYYLHLSEMLKSTILFTIEITSNAEGNVAMIYTVRFYSNNRFGYFVFMDSDMYGSVINYIVNGAKDGMYKQVLKNEKE